MTENIENEKNYALIKTLECGTEYLVDDDFESLDEVVSMMKTEWDNLGYQYRSELAKRDYCTIQGIPYMRACVGYDEESGECKEGYDLSECVAKWDKEDNHTWRQKGLIIYEEEYDGDAKCFEIYSDSEDHYLLATLYPADWRDSAGIATDLTDGVSIRDMEDGNGVSMSLHICRGQLRRRMYLAESAGEYYNDEDGTYWLVGDEVYHHETDDLDFHMGLLSDDDVDVLEIYDRPSRLRL